MYKNMWYYNFGDNMNYLFLFDILNDIDDEIKDTKLKLNLIRK